MSNGTTFVRGVSITPSDTPLDSPCDAIYVGGAGNIVITGPDGVDYTLMAIIPGTIYHVAAQAIKAATTASNIVALY